MPTITPSPTLQNSLGEVANGIIVFKASSSFESGGNVITTAAGKGVVRDGVLLTSQQGGALFVPATPATVVMEIVLVLDEFRDGQIREVESLRTVTVPDVATISWSALVDVVPVATAGTFIVPQWATDVLVARDTTVTKAAEAASSAAAALAAKDAAEAVGTTNDTIMQGIDGNAASAFRVQADARQSATMDGKVTAGVAPKLDKTEGVTRYDGAAQLAEAGALMRKLVLGTANAALLILGDSTGQGNMTTIKRWPLRLTELLMALFPTHTFIFYLWNNTSVAYDAPVTLQTGTGSRTVTIYNGSASGMTSAYNITNLAVMAPVEPDLTIISHGHNEDSTSVKTSLTKLARYVTAKWPRSPIVLTVQNQQLVASPAYVDQMATRVAIAQVAAREGYGLIDIASAYLAYPNFDTVLYSGGDYTHPNDAGMAYWAAEVFARLQRAPRSIAKRGKVPTDRIYVPSSLFLPSIASPTMSYTTTLGAARSGWALDPLVQEAVSAVVDVPLDWVSLNLHVYWTTLVAAGGTGGVMSMSVGIGASRSIIGQNDTVYPSADSAITVFGSGMTLSETVPAAGEVGYVRKRTYTYGTANAYPATRGIHEMTVYRNGNSGSDTLPVDAIFLGVLFERIE